MDRVPEPELMDSAEQAAAYAAADFSAPHQAVVSAFCERFPDVGHSSFIDLGCGPADVTVRFAHALPRAAFLAVDGASAMLEHARARITHEGLQDRIRCARAVLPDPTLPTGFDAVISNSVLHHLHDPAVLWNTVRQVAAPGAIVFVSDLRRPESTDDARRIVATYSSDEPDVLRQDFFYSLCAAFTPDEVRTQLGDLPLTVEVTSDRHLVVHGRFPA